MLEDFRANVLKENCTHAQLHQTEWQQYNLVPRARADQKERGPWGRDWKQYTNKIGARG